MRFHQQVVEKGSLQGQGVGTDSRCIMQARIPVGQYVIKFININHGI